MSTAQPPELSPHTIRVAIEEGLARVPRRFERLAARPAVILERAFMDMQSPDNAALSRSGQLLYMDHHHSSRAGSLFFADKFPF